MAATNTSTNRSSSRRGARRPASESQEREFDQKTVELSRVSRVMAGGKRMRFRAVVAIGDHKGQVGIGVAKAADVPLAISKAVTIASKHLIRVPLYEDTIPHAMRTKFA